MMKQMFMLLTMGDMAQVKSTDPGFFFLEARKFKSQWIHGRLVLRSVFIYFAMEFKILFSKSKCLTREPYQQECNFIVYKYDCRVDFCKLTAFFVERGEAGPSWAKVVSMSLVSFSLCLTCLLNRASLFLDSTCLDFLSLVLLKLVESYCNK